MIDLDFIHVVFLKSHRRLNHIWGSPGKLSRVSATSPLTSGFEWIHTI